MQKNTIIKGLNEIGASFAIRSDKFVCTDSRCCDPYNSPTIPMYHIHPDASEPREDAILPFYNLAQIASYIAMRKSVAAAANDEDACQIRQDWKDARN